MSTLTTTARGHATVEPRLQAGTVVVKVGDAVLSLDIAEALQVGQQLLAAAAPTGESIAGNVTATACPVKKAVVVAVDGRPLLDLSPAAWTALSMQGSSAALELQGPTLRVGLRSARLQRGNSDLVEALQTTSAELERQINDPAALASEGFAAANVARAALARANGSAA